MVHHVSYNHEKRGVAAGTHAEYLAKMTFEAMIMQDADRLNALGFIGVGRCKTSVNAGHCGYSTGSYLGARVDDEDRGR